MANLRKAWRGAQGARADGTIDAIIEFIACLLPRRFNRQNGPVDRLLIALGTKTGKRLRSLS